MGRTMLTDVDAATQAMALADVRAALEPYVTDQGVLLGSSTWLVAARA